MNRIWEIDALRGLLLVLMTLTHFPSKLTGGLSQPFGYVSAAEGFVLMSGFMAGMVYSRKGLREGLPAMRTALVSRSLTIYLCHLALLVFTFTVFVSVAMFTEHSAALGVLKFYFDGPLLASIAAFIMLHKPPLLDILPMYVLFMVASPWVLTTGLQRGWGLILLASVALWVASQFGFGVWAYEHLLGEFAEHVPARNTGAFSPLSWQLLWVVGLWMGSAKAQNRTDLFAFSASTAWCALSLVAVFFVWRYVMGFIPFGENAAANMWFDKWTLAPLRMANLLAMVVAVIYFAPRFTARMQPPQWLITLGQASLPVFCAHLVIVLLALAVLGGAYDPRPVVVDLVALGLCFAGLYKVAQWSNLRSAKAKAKMVRQASFVH